MGPLSRAARSAAVLIGLALGCASGLARADERLIAAGACRDGHPHGAYELKAADGNLRIIGAFNRGKRTGSFIFWNAAGVRIAHVPFDDDLISGTVALWHPVKGDPEPRQRLEAVYTMGRLNGVKRSWYPDGRIRAEFAYANGALAEAKAWSRAGVALPQAKAEALAAADLAADERYFRSLDDEVRRHPPDCRTQRPHDGRA